MPVPAKSCPSCGERYDADVLYCPRDGTPLASARSPSIASAEGDGYLGLELAGQIRLEHLIGIGSMGRVYRAFQAGIDRDVAVKILHRELSGNAELVARFHREAKVASRLVHPNVVQVLMTGTVPFTGDPRIGGELYLVMEHLDGISLLSALAASGEGAALPLPRALHVVLQICDAVGEAHEQGIVHRDLKPENVMLVRRGEDPAYVKVLDFGIARLDWADRSMATQAGLIFGTAKYISPEGAEGHPVGPAADVYSIATMLYQCLAGRTPFEGESPVALLVQHTHAPPPDLRGIPRASYVPAPIASVVMQNLSKKPSERAPNARAFGRDLLAAARDAGLDPDEILPQSTLLFTRGVVKLASRERTKSLDLSPELAARIGGVASADTPAPAAPPVPRAAPSDPRATPLATLAPEPADASAEAGGQSAASAGARGPSAPSSTVYAAPQATQLSTPAPGGTGLTPAPGVERTLDDDDIHPGRAGATPPPAEHASRPMVAAPAQPGGPLPRPSEPRSSTTPHVSPAPGASDAGDLAPVVPASPRVPSGLDPGEGPASAEPLPARRTARAKIARAVAVLSCAAAAGMVLVIGGRHAGLVGTGASALSDSLDAQLDAARECMRRHAWDMPPQHNVKDITTQALLRWPSDPRVADIRREAAERVVADALGRKYAGDAAEALRLARLALEFHPDLTTAQHLVAELSARRGPEVAPATAAPSSSPAPPPRRPPKESRDARATAAIAPTPTPKAAATGAPAAPPIAAQASASSPSPSAPSAPPASSATAGEGSVPVLPPPPPPLPPDHAPPAPPATGPWL